MTSSVARLRRLLGRSPSYILRRAGAEMRAEFDRLLWAKRTMSFNHSQLIGRSDFQSLSALWDALAEQPWPVPTHARNAKQLDAIKLGASTAIIGSAERGCRHEVDLLGTGRVYVGNPISWDIDFKTGEKWPSCYFRDIKTVDPNTPSDVKIPWELSRLQWLIPIGQAYLLTLDERYAISCREILSQWIDANPVCSTVNWAIAMEPAMRVFTWTWLFRVFSKTMSWADESFRERLLCSLYQHGLFISRYIESADLNGNHYTADCAALVVVGSFFFGAESEHWLRKGIKELEREILIQILGDGVDFEGSSSYHRFVTELLLIAAIHGESKGLLVSDEYKRRLRNAARFSAAYARPDGTAPLWGDADDARVLPFGTSSINDHRHIVKCVASYLGDDELASLTDGGGEELFWLFGEKAREPKEVNFVPPNSQAFCEGGAYVLRSGNGHVFIDCGTVGFGGRGGHGHNDTLSFEAVLNGIAVVEESGCYVYTASFAERNFFRSTSAHNTPKIDGEEINRFIDPNLLWYLQDDAHPMNARILEEADSIIFEGAHDGYLRLSSPVIPRRRILLCRDGMSLTVCDSFEGGGTHEIRIPIQLARNWKVVECSSVQAICRHCRGSHMRVTWIGAKNWEITVSDSRIAPSYGVVVPTQRLEWVRRGSIDSQGLTVKLELMA